MMEKLTFDEILVAVDGEILKNSGVEIYDSVSTDTRKDLENCIFFALNGENFNGNKFVEMASEKGATLCIVDEELFDKTSLKEFTSVILVKDTKKALLDLAEYYRSKLSLKVVGITGSTGKTSTKDILAAMLSNKYKVFKTKGNFNNEIGLPLMIFKLDKSFDIAVLEMGMSNLGEIERLAKCARPNIGIITNIGDSHLENLKTRDNILKAKMEITNYFNENNQLIINSENDLLKNINNKNYRVIKIGSDGEFDFAADKIKCNINSVEFKLLKENIFKKEFNLKVPGVHNVLNSLLAIACANLLGVDFEDMEKGMENIERTSMRLEISKTNYFTVINDCYNASPDSMKAAIDILKNNKGRKVAIIGTMKELGEKSAELHRSIGKYAFDNNIDVLVTIGEYSKEYCKDFCEKECYEFCTIDDALEKLNFIVKTDDTILVKASRSVKFEKIVDYLLKYEE